MGKFTFSAKGGGRPAGDGPLFVDTEFEARYPALVEYLRETQQEDGGPRTTATLLLMVDAGRLKAWLNDRDNRRAAWVTGMTFVGLLETLENGLQEDSLEWRETKEPPRRK